MTEADDTTTPDERAAIAARVLDWYVAMGADAAVQSAAVNWWERPEGPLGVQALTGRAGTTNGQPVAGRPAAPPPPAGRGAPQDAARRQEPPRAAPAGLRPAAAAAPDDLVRHATALAREATTLADLRQQLERFDGCGLKATAKNACLFRGAEQARVMVIGEAPGRDEDRAGMPFVGRAGQLLDKMLASIGLDETSVHITNVVYWRPPGNRTPTPIEVEVCRPFLDRQIDLVQPEVIVTVGGPAAKALLGVQAGIMKVRGSWRTLPREGGEIKLMPTLHPAYLLRTPAAKRLAWRDLLEIRDAIDGRR